MRLLIAAVGKLKQGPERDLFEHYLARTETSGRKLGIAPVALVEVPESRGPTPAARTAAAQTAARVAACLALSATLKNRAPFAQTYPHLELTLTDTADKAILRKVLPPEAYLPRATPLAAGMAPNADLAINLALDAGGLSASGYRLYIFYP